MTGLQQQLIRQLEACLRRGGGLIDTRWKLIQTGMTKDQVWDIELPIRRRIRSERAAKQTTRPRAAAQEEPTT